MKIETARAIALGAHAGQTEKDGAPYINHLDRVAAAAPDDLKVAAYFHDIVEDTKVTLVMLSRWGVGLHDLMVIKTLTRKPAQETYPQFITDIIDSNLQDAILLKLFDVQDHLRPGCELVLTEKQILKYITAEQRLIEALA